MPEQTITVGRTVLYTLTQSDADRINALPGDGNTAHEGDVYPAIVVRVWGPPLANLQVLFDGEGSLWATSRTEGDRPGTWHWPTRG